MTLRIPGFEVAASCLSRGSCSWSGSDVAAYSGAKIVGKRKIAPALSPSKTVEGFVAASRARRSWVALLAWLTPFAPWQAGLIALVVCLMGFFGGS